jgi:hypothetical protein
MDSKKHFASLMEDHSPGPSTAAVGNGARSGSRSGNGESALPPLSHPDLGLVLGLDANHDHDHDHAAMSCVYVSHYYMCLLPRGVGA